MEGERQRVSGVCVSWRGTYGHIHQDGQVRGERDAFTHFEDIESDGGYRRLFIGQRVSFVPSQDDRGRTRALHVIPEEKW